MKLSEITLACRDRVNDRDSKYWTDVQIVRWINQHVRALFRQRVNADVSYGMRRITLAAAAATQLNAYTFSYQLPRWVYRVRWVHDKKAVTEARGRVIAPLMYGRGGMGWTFTGNHRLEVHGWGEAFDEIILDVAKVPALLHSGTVSQTLTASEIALDYEENASFLYPIERENGAYIGSMIEITAGQDATRDPRGVIGDVQSQDQSTWDAGLLTYPIVCTVAPDYEGIPTAGDTYEMHAEIDDAHLNYLTLLVARSLLSRQKNIQGMEAIEMELKGEQNAFIDGIQPRQDYYPAILGDPSGAALQHSADVDPLWPNGIF